jgi:hypothetical protein
MTPPHPLVLEVFLHLEIKALLLGKASCIFINLDV